jgi:hypothetical protein
MRLAAAGRDGDTLQQVRAALPAEVRVTSVTHPLFGQLVQASGFKRWKGELLLVVTLPDGSPGTVPAAATDLLGAPGAADPAGMTTLSVEGLQRLHRLVGALGPPAKSRGRSAGSK